MKLEHISMIEQVQAALAEARAADPNGSDRQQQRSLMIAEGLLGILMTLSAMSERLDAIDARLEKLEKPL